MLPEDHPLSLGAGMHLPAAGTWLEGWDVVLVVGTELAAADLWGPPPALAGRLIRVDVDPLRCTPTLPATSR